MRATGYIWDGNTGEQIAWIENGTNVFSVATGQVIATLHGTDLYSLSGEFLNVHLENSHEVVSTGRSTDAIANFRKLAARPVKPTLITNEH